MVPSPAPREYLEAVAGGPMMGMQLCFIQGARAVSSGMKSRWSSCIHSNRGAGAVGVAAVLVWLSKGGVGERSRLQKKSMAIIRGIKIYPALKYQPEFELQHSTAE